MPDIIFAGYSINGWLFVTVFGVILFCILAFLFYRRARETKYVYAYAKKTRWQQEELKGYLKARKDFFSGDELDFLEDYLKENYWNDEELLEKSDTLVMHATKAFYDFVYRNLLQHPEPCVLLLHVIDQLNGGMDFSPGSGTGANAWMDDGLPMELSQYGDDSMNRALSLGLAALDRAYTEYVDPLIDQIPTVSMCIPLLRGLSAKAIEAANAEVLEKESLEDLSDEALSVLSLCLADMILFVIRDKSFGSLEDYHLSYFRALASFIAAEPYPEVVEDAYAA